MLPQNASKPEILIELMDPENENTHHLLLTWLVE
jgi:hypothetical protein